MALNLSKAYTPSSGQIANSSSYNTDIANLFNAFSGLEGQTSTLGGLTITPSANGTTKFLVNNAAGTELFSLDTTNSYLKLKATGRFYLDGGNDTYIVESSANNIGLYAGGVLAININSSGINIPATNTFALDGGGDTYMVESSANNILIYAGGVGLLSINSSGINIPATKTFALDGGGDTYMVESAANVLGFVAGNTTRLELNSTTGTTGGSGSGGTGNQYVELKIAGVRYKLLHDGNL